jgi:uncharacterized membrane protein YczE
MMIRGFLYYGVCLQALLLGNSFKVTGKRAKEKLIEMKKTLVILVKYLSNLGLRRILCMFAGNTLLGIGIAFYRHAALGNDPFSAMTLSLSMRTPLNYGTFLLLFNLFLFSFQFFFGKKYIGIGTLVNWTLVGYVADFCMYLDTHYITLSDTYPVRLIVLLSAILISAMGVSLYQTSASGISPYDYLSLGLSEQAHLPYLFCRIACDATAVIIALIVGGLVGIGTFLTVLMLGPSIQFFTRNVSKKLLKQV